MLYVREQPLSDRVRLPGHALDDARAVDVVFDGDSFGYSGDDPFDMNTPMVRGAVTTLMDEVMIHNAELARVISGAESEARRR